MVVGSAHKGERGVAPRRVSPTEAARFKATPPQGEKSTASQDEAGAILSYQSKPPLEPQAQPTCFLSGALNTHKDAAEPGHEVSAPTKADDEGKNVGMGAALCSRSAPHKT